MQEETKHNEVIATAVTPGTYRLRLVTHGYGTPDANLVTLAKKVTVKE